MESLRRTRVLRIRALVADLDKGDRDNWNWFAFWLSSNTIYIFAQIQNSQKELEIKNDLIKEMSSAIMDPIMMVQVLEQGRRNDTIIDLGNSTIENVLTDERLKDIQAARLIESQLRAYFPYNLSLARDWNNIFAIAYNFANLYLEDDEVKRGNLIGEIYRFLNIKQDSNVTEELKDRSINNKDDYRHNSEHLQNLTKAKYDNLTKSILTNHIPEYRPDYRKILGID
jgi:hypothetical protein